MAKNKQSKCYLGIDIGTTNTKALYVTEQGVVAEVLKEYTPVRDKHGVCYLDLRKLENIINRFLLKISSQYRLEGVCFTSIGESIIPVGGGKALADPLLWYEQATDGTAQSVYPRIRELVDYSVTGVGNDSTLGLYKLLWMKEHLDLEDVEFWLPISSYFIYRNTGVAVWDYSQAGRSYAVDIHGRCWNERLLDRFDLQDCMGELSYMGREVAEDDNGVRYFLGGHDHICGLNYVRELFGRRPFIYDSLGSSAFTVTLAEEKDRELHFRESFMKPNGIIGIGFREKQYYLQNSIRYAGKLLQALAGLTGVARAGTPGFYDEMNRRIGERVPAAERNCLFVVGGDLNADLRSNTYSLLNIPLQADAVDLVHSAYLYLCTMTRLIVGRLREFIREDPVFFTGGATVSNKMLMEYKASILGRPVNMLDIEELSALGTVFCVLQGLDEHEVIEKVSTNTGTKTVYPNAKLRASLLEMSDAMLEQYRILKGQAGLDVLQLITSPGFAS